MSESARIPAAAQTVRAAIMQPTYLPWLGYFDLMDAVDEFVLLDSVQFDKRSWQQRNRIKTEEGLALLTVPVRSKGRYHQSIDRVELVDDLFATAHLKRVQQVYREAPYFQRYFDAFAATLRAGAASGRLAQLNEGLIDWLARQFGIATPRRRASTLRVAGKRAYLLAAICRAISVKSYLSPAGASGYLKEEANAFEQADIDVAIQVYEHPEYLQLHPPFVPYASALDLLFNAGPDSLAIIRSGRRQPIPLALWPDETAGDPVEADGRL